MRLKSDTGSGRCRYGLIPDPVDADIYHSRCCCGYFLKDLQCVCAHVSSNSCTGPTTKNVLYLGGWESHKEIWLHWTLTQTLASQKTTKRKKLLLSNSTSTMQPRRAVNRNIYAPRRLIMMMKSCKEINPMSFAYSHCPRRKYEYRPSTTESRSWTCSNLNM